MVDFNIPILQDSQVLTEYASNLYALALGRSERVFRRLAKHEQKRRSVSKRQTALHVMQLMEIVHRAAGGLAVHRPMQSLDRDVAESIRCLGEQRWGTG